MEVPAVYTFAPSSRMQTKFIPCYRTYMHTCIQALASYSGSRTLEDSDCQISVYPLEVPQIYHERCLLNTSPTALSLWNRGEGDVSTNYLCFQVATILTILHNVMQLATTG